MSEILIEYTKEPDGTFDTAIAYEGDISAGVAIGLLEYYAKTIRSKLNEKAIEMGYKNVSDTPDGWVYTVDLACLLPGNTKEQ